MATGAIAGVIKVVGIALSAKSLVEGIKEGNLFQAVVGAVGAYYGLSSLAATGAAGSGASSVADGAAQTAGTAGANTADQVASEVASKAAKSAVEAGAESAAKEAVGKSLETAAGEVAKETVGSSLIGDFGTSVIEVGNQAPAGIIGEKMGETAATSVIDKAVSAGNTITGAGATSAIDKAIASGKTIESPSFMDRVADGAGKLKGIIDSGMKPIGDALNIDGTTIQKGLDFFNENPVVAQSGLQLAGSYLQAKGEEELMDRQERLYAERRKRMGTPGDVSPAASIRWDEDKKRFVQTVT